MIFDFENLKTHITYGFFVEVNNYKISMEDTHKQSMGNPEGSAHTQAYRIVHLMPSHREYLNDNWRNNHKA